MTTLKTILVYLWSHRTKVSGALTATTGLLAASSVVPAKVSAMASVILGLLTIWIGVFNSQQDPPGTEQ